MTVWGVSGVTHLAGLSSSLPLQYLFTHLNFPFSLDALYYKRLGNAQKLKSTQCPGLRHFKNGHFLYYT